MRGYAVVDAYLGDTGGEVMAANVDADGWFHSGDLCSLTPEGWLVYHCRMGDSLRLKGFLVEPAEIESVLAGIPEVGMVKAVGVQDEGSTRLVVFVTAAEGQSLDPEAVREYAVAHLARHKVPDAVHVLDAMPVTRGPNGTKIRAATLRELATTLRDSGSR